MTIPTVQGVRVCEYRVRPFGDAWAVDTYDRSGRWAGASVGLQKGEAQRLARLWRDRERRRARRVARASDVGGALFWLALFATGMVLA